MVPASDMIPVHGTWNGGPGTPDEERISGAVSYLDVLDRLHRELRPAHYLEIGVRHGKSLALARGSATGVDPAPAIEGELPRSTTVVPLTSDDFFAQVSAASVFDFCFIDGLHLFEYALRDFMNIERRAAPGAVVVIDDILPNHPAQAGRERRTRVWTGDVWRLADILRQHRPDLFVMPLDTDPAGLLLVAGLDSANRVLWERFEDIVNEARALPGPAQRVLERHGALDPSDAKLSRVIETLARTRRDGAHPHEMVAQLRAAAGETPDPDAAATEAPKLSVVLIGYNMARELPRTIRSLSPLMPRGIAARDYEVILIDNGSTQAADEAELRRHLPHLVVHSYAPATVSPVPAINFGLYAGARRPRRRLCRWCAHGFPGSSGDGPGGFAAPPAADDRNARIPSRPHRADGKRGARL